MHPVYDTDNHFTIDPVTRMVTNAQSHKTTLIQGDHNSERFTFELPKEIEGHDMKQCNVVQVHFNNIDVITKEQSKAFYQVTDLDVCDTDPSKLVLSWLISSEATKFVGPLSFVIRFSCVSEDGKVHYVWNTAVYSNITVANGICNTEVVIEEYTDLLAGWIADLEANQVISIEQTTTATESEGVNVLTVTFGDGRTSTFEIRNGGRGPKGLVGSIETIDGYPLHFFVGTTAEYDALDETTKHSGLFAIITDKMALENGALYDSTIYTAFSSSTFGEHLEVVCEGFELRDGVEILVSPMTASGFVSGDTSSDHPTLNVGDTGEYEITNGFFDFQYSSSFWGANDVLRFQFDGIAGKWLFAENITQKKTYPIEWRTASGYYFKPGETYDLRFFAKNGPNPGSLCLAHFTIPEATSGYSDLLLPSFDLYGTNATTAGTRHRNITVFLLREFFPEFHEERNVYRYHLTGEVRDNGEMVGTLLDSNYCTDIKYRVVK